MDTYVAKVSWWPSESPELGIIGAFNTDQIRTRTLNGEMRLTANLRPSFKFGDVGIRVSTFFLACCDALTLNCLTVFRMCVPTESSWFPM